MDWKRFADAMPPEASAVQETHRLILCDSDDDIEIAKPWPTLNRWSVIGVEHYGENWDTDVDHLAQAYAHWALVTPPQEGQT